MPKPISTNRQHDNKTPRSHTKSLVFQSINNNRCLQFPIHFEVRMKESSYLQNYGFILSKFKHPDQSKAEKATIKQYWKQ